MNKSTRQTGAGLVELLVGMFISLLVLLGVMSSIGFYQGAQRTAVSGNNALANALSGMYLLGNDIRQAGLGLSSNGALACERLNAYYNGIVIANSTTLAPVQIKIDGNNRAQLSIMYADTISAGAPAPLLANMANSTAEITINKSIGTQTGALALLTLPGSTQPCTLIGVTQVDNTGNETLLQHTAAGSLYNPANPDASYSTSVVYSTAAQFMNVGNFRWVTWRITNNRLEVVDNFTGATEQISDNIVQLQAEYGVSDGVNPGINQWVSATGAWANLTPALVSRILAVRVAVIARNTKRERDFDDNGICATTTMAPISWAGSASVDMSNDTHWQCYRYNTVRMVFPLKNISWGST